MQMKHYSLFKVAVELDVQTFILEEYLQEQGFEIIKNRILPIREISEAAYKKALENKILIQTLEEIRINELELKISYLKEKVKTWEVISWNEDDFVKLGAYSSELIISESLKQAREFQKENLSFYASDLQVDSAHEVYEESEERVEYSIYNSTGYVTFTTELMEAREMARQFGGYIVDENGKKIF